MTISYINKKHLLTLGQSSSDMSCSKYGFIVSPVTWLEDSPHILPSPGVPTECRHCSTVGAGIHVYSIRLITQSMKWSSQSVSHVA